MLRVMDWLVLLGGLLNVIARYRREVVARQQTSIIHHSTMVFPSYYCCCVKIISLHFDHSPFLRIQAVSEIKPYIQSTKDIDIELLPESNRPYLSCSSTLDVGQRKKTLSEC